VHFSLPFPPFQPFFKIYLSLKAKLLLSSTGFQSPSSLLAWLALVHLAIPILKPLSRAINSDKSLITR